MGTQLSAELGLSRGDQFRNQDQFVLNLASHPGILGELGAPLKNHAL